MAKIVKKRKISVKKISIALIFFCILFGGGIFAFKYFHHEKKPTAIKISSIDSIEGYDYSLDCNETKYFKSLFKELKNCLEADDLDNDKYAQLVTKLFVADFYNLDNKINKNDIGGEQFIYKDFRDDFKKLASTSMYKSVKNNIYGKRKQKLPVVIKVSTELGDKTSFKYGNDNDSEAYVVNFDISYKDDLGYQKSGVITLIHNDKKLEIAKLAEKEGE